MATQQPHSFLFADICDYSVLSEKAGDEAAADVAIRFSSKVASMAKEHGVELVRRIGDEVMVHGDSAPAVLAFGVRLMDELSGKAGIPQVHAGIHTGPALARSGDWWGATVNVASRVSTAATKGQLLITEATRLAAAAVEDTADLNDLGMMRFKNISLPVRVYSASPAPCPQRTAREGRRRLRSSRFARRARLFDPDFATSSLSAEAA